MVRTLGNPVPDGSTEVTTLADLAAMLRRLRRRHARTRDDAQLTYRELAAKTGWAHGVIGDYFAGKVLPPTDRFDILIRLLGAAPAEQRALATARDRVEEVRRRARTGDSRVAVPRELVCDVSTFVGREAELAELDLLLAGKPAMVSVVVSGTAGVGKTALAVHWAHRVRDHFPDGQLHVALHGYGSGTPLEPLEALARFLVALDVPPTRIPSDVDSAATMYRSMLANKRMLVLLDNAHRPDQVRALLPNSPGCLVLITSRDDLAGLVARDGAVRLALDTPSPSEAQALLTRLIGAERTRREPAALTSLAELCGYLPLALRIAAAALVVEPGSTIASYVARLANDDRLNILQLGGDPQAAVRVAFDDSYAALSSEARRLFRLLGLVPGPHVTARAAAALANVPPTEAARLLDRLTSAHLLDEHTPGRYSFHDLLRDYAAERADTGESAPERTAALERLHDYYLRSVDGAARWLYPHVLRLPAPEGAAPLAVQFDGHAQASAWLDAERANLVAAAVHAAEQGFAAAAYRLADALRGYLYLRMHTVDWLRVARAGLAAADSDGDPRAQAAAHASLATLYWAQGRHHEAIDHYTVALVRAQHAGWVDGGATALGNLGNLHWALGRLDAAAEYYSRVLDLFQQTEQVGRQATALGNLGLVYFAQGRLDEALDRCTEALALHRKTNSHAGEVRALTDLGEIYLAIDRPDDALGALTDALTLLRMIGDRNIEGDTLRTLAAVHRDIDNPREALAYAGKAVDLALETGDRRVEAGASTTLASIHCRLGSYDAAVNGHRHALNVAREIGNRYIETEALLGLAAAYRGTGQEGDAADLAAEALILARDCGYERLYAKAQAEMR